MGSRVDSYLRVPPIRDICPVDRSGFPQLYQTWTPVKRWIEKKDAQMRSNLSILDDPWSSKKKSF